MIPLSSMYMLITRPRSSSGTVVCIRVLLATRKAYWQNPNPVRNAKEAIHHGTRENRTTKSDPPARPIKVTKPLRIMNPVPAMMTAATTPPTPMAAAKMPPVAASLPRTSVVNTGSRNIKG